ncbi:alkaline phosphatase [Brevibacterium daeguense]|uniref:Alkaline phosphatase n=1 Tax=Brevibacterium daeguense TaxID=909936 RepID=A0ABP8EGY2_9MICO
MTQSISRAVAGAISAAALAVAVTAAGSVTPALAAPPSAGPKNVIYMIGDGMGYNHVAGTNIFETGQAMYQTEEDEDGNVTELDGDPVQVYEQDDFNRVALSTYQHGNDYDGEAAWSDFGYVNEDVTDSAAAGTAMATGQKTTNGVLGQHPETGDHLTNLSEVARETGRSSGVVSSVQYNHATPASFAVSNINRNNYVEIGSDMINAEHLDVVMGAGHPEFDDNGEPQEASYDYIGADDYAAVSSGETEWDYVEDVSDFEALASGELESDKLFGLAQVATTLQQARSDSGELPGEHLNDNVPDLSTMSEGALNVLGDNDEGFHLMIEGGAIDWTGHANDTVRNIEEQQDFNAAVESVVDWVEDHSSWKDTLLIVTADHETGYLWGEDSDPDYTPLSGAAGELPEVGWHSTNHTNHLVPFYFKGAGSEQLMRLADEEDPARGAYLDNVEPARLLMETWAEGDESGHPGNPPKHAEPNGPPSHANPGVGSSANPPAHANENARR